MSNLIHLCERRGRHVAYTSGITGRSGSGYVSTASLIIAPDGRELKREFNHTRIWGSLHDAEYMGVQSLINLLEEQSAINRLSVYCSSQFVVNQLTGKCNIKMSRHQDFVDDIINTLSHIDLSFTWIPGRRNLIKNWHWTTYGVREAQNA